MSSYNVKIKIMRDMSLLKKFLTPEKYNEIQAVCLKSVFNGDVLGKILARYMSEVEQKEYFYIHALLLCKEVKHSMILDEFLKSQFISTYQEFCGIYQKPFPYFEIGKTVTRQENLSIYSARESYEEFSQKNLVETLAHEKMELSTQDIAIYLPVQIENETVSEPGYFLNLKFQRDYLNAFLQEFILNSSETDLECYLEKKVGNK